MYVTSTHSAGGQSFFNIPGVMAGIIAGAVVALICLVIIALVVIRRRRRTSEQIVRGCGIMASRFTELDQRDKN